MLFWKKKVENDTNISHINRQKDWKTNILMIFVRYNKQFCKGDKKIHWNVLTTISLSDIIYSQRAYSRRKKWIYFIHFLQKQMKFCCGREKKEPFFPKSRLPQRSFCVMLRNVLHLLENWRKHFCAGKNGIILSALFIACVTEAPMVSAHTLKRRKEEMSNNNNEMKKELDRKSVV